MLGTFVLRCKTILCPVDTNTKKDTIFIVSFFGCFELNGTNEMCLKTLIFSTTYVWSILISMDLKL